MEKLGIKKWLRFLSLDIKILAVCALLVTIYNNSEPHLIIEAKQYQPENIWAIHIANSKQYTLIHSYTFFVTNEWIKPGRIKSIDVIQKFINTAGVKVQTCWINEVMTKPFSTREIQVDIAISTNNREYLSPKSLLSFTLLFFDNKGNPIKVGDGVADFIQIRANSNEYEKIKKTTNPTNYNPAAFSEIYTPF